MPDNVYTNAAQTYGTHAQKNSGDPRETEARVLLKAANMLQDLQTHWNPDDHAKLDETLKYNRQIWMLFFDTAVENKDGNRPADLRSNIINLANFVFKRTVDILSEPKREKLDILISINRDIAAGLMTGPGAAPMPNTVNESHTTSA
jgi:flagellar biosynthesis activator protein FlaF